MRRIFSVAGGLAGAVALAGVVAAPAAYADPVTLNGTAFGVKVDVKADNASLVNVAPLPSVSSNPGGDKSTIELDSGEIAEETDGVVNAKVINAASAVKDRVLTSRASVADLAVRLKSTDADVKGVLALTAEIVTAKCTYGPDGVAAESVLANVDIQSLAGLKKELVAANADAKPGVKPNTSITVAGVGKVVLNEQIASDNGITVNAIHVYLTPKLKLLYGDIIVSQATCYMGAASTPDPDPSSPGASPDPSDSAAPGEPSDPNPGASETAPGGEAGGDLPVTGFKLATFAGIGAALVAAGIGALWFARRRRTTADAS